jgi:SAM-dependent methyltransferase
MLSFIAFYDRCPVCESSACVGAHAIDLDEATRIRWWRCADCGLVFQNPRLTEQSLRDLYARVDYFGLRGSGDPAAAYADFMRFDAVRIAQGRRRIARIAKVSGVTSGRLLDVGSASGFFGVAARDAGFEVTCIEPDAELAAIGREKYGLSFLTGPMEDCWLERESYDVITAWGTDSLFLHPLQSMQKLAGALRPGGALALNYQAYDHWIRIIFPRLLQGWNVIYNHTDASFDLVLEKSGMHLLARELEWQAVSIDHIGRVLRTRVPAVLKSCIVRVPAISLRFVVARRA